MLSNHSRSPFLATMKFCLARGQPDRGGGRNYGDSYQTSHCVLPKWASTTPRSTYATCVMPWGMATSRRLPTSTQSPRLLRGSRLSTSSALNRSWYRFRGLSCLNSADVSGVRQPDRACLLSLAAGQPNPKRQPARSGVAISNPYPTSANGTSC